MALVRITRTVLVEQSFVTDINSVLFPFGTTMEDGTPFEENVLLIEREMEGKDKNSINISQYNEEIISNETIIKIEQL